MTIFTPNGRLKTKAALFFIFIGLIGHGQNSSHKELAELTKDRSGWKTVSTWINDAKEEVRILKPDSIKASNNLFQLQVSTRSAMGAIVFETGGLIIKNGMLRILGSGNPEMNRGIMEWNKGKSYVKDGETPSFLLFADDVFGGFFALNAGYFSEEYKGKVYYLAPDTLKWENLDLTYSEFLNFCLSGKLDTFYENFKWKNFSNDVAGSDSDSAFVFYPYLFTEEGKDIEKVSKKLVPIEELWRLYNDLQRKLGQN